MGEIGAQLAAMPQPGASCEGHGHGGDLQANHTQHFVTEAVEIGGCGHREQTEIQVYVEAVGNISWNLIIASSFHL